ncbi:hypothetical protein DK26_14900 [Bosea sp. WAO]|uniref:hypothetical protein n=1 Tax=Bosea sp. WAO TaxID=406341 RepID=UPI000749240E|nr:hypothetical protein [Bosea sp. WAO]KUL94303.1 hypothetical protein DK26_14900 [Bosea sp. WAO]
MDAIPEFDNTQADAEGWGIYECDGSSNGPYQICRDDEAAVFASDDAAWRHVIDGATAGSAYHIRAMDYIREHNPAEWCAYGREHKRVLTHKCGAPMLDAEGYLINAAGQRISYDADDEPLRFRQGGGAVRER